MAEKNHLDSMRAILDARDTINFRKVSERFKLATGHKLTRGSASLQSYEITEEDAMRYNLRFYVRGQHEYMVNAGKYTRLLIDKQLYMSDTYMEYATNLEFLEYAKGDILIAGLGMGLILHNLVPKFEKRQIGEITIVENNKDVIDLISPFFSYLKPKIIHADILEYSPKGMFDTIYFDIWESTCADNYEEMELLRTMWQPHLKKNGWMGSWNEDECLNLLNEEDGWD